MTLKEANKLIEQASAAIFEIEGSICKSPYSDSLRQEGYRVRIAIGQFSDHIKILRDEDDISIDK